MISRCIQTFAVTVAVLLGPMGAHAQAPRASVTFVNGTDEAAVVKLIGPHRRQVEVPKGKSSTTLVEIGRAHV